MRESSLVFLAEDGFQLSGTLFEPETPPLGAVLVNGATGVQHAYYKAFCIHLASLGLVVLSYDYRGIGGSALGFKDPDKLTMRAWGELDTAAAIELLAERFPDCALLMVGHSVGGQLLGLAPNNHRIQAAYMIASQSGYWRLWPLRLQPMMAAMWWLAVPVALHVFGYLPRQLAGYPLPRGIAAEWRRWCTHRDFIVDERGVPIREGFQRYRGALRMIHIEDDDSYAPRAAVAALASFYTGTAPDVATLYPRDIGLSKLGHFGFFRRTVPTTAWDAVADWLLESTQSLRRDAQHNRKAA